MNRKYAILALFLVLLISVSLVLTANWLKSQASTEFYLGVEYAYGDKVEEVKALVDKVKNYTNLFVIGSVNLTFNKPALDEACDYIFSSNLNLIVLFTGSDMYQDKYNIFEWMVDARQKYGDKFLGIYRYDEPGGNQLDNGTSRLIQSGTDYSHVAQNYTFNLGSIVGHYLNFSQRVFTADYALYWFDYKSLYSTVFAEFVGNQSRQRHIALGRGAAEAFNKDFGVIVTWKYEGEPYLESGEELYDDLVSAYQAGAKYAIVFSYPQIDSFGTLTENHFEALQRFWMYAHDNPQSFGSNKAEIAYVVPTDYGFGFRNRDDNNIWGLFPNDEFSVGLSAKIFSDVESLIGKYDFRLDILYDEPEIILPLLKNYKQVFYWNQTIT